MMFAYKPPLKFSFNFAFVTFQLLLFLWGYFCLFGGLFGIFPTPNYFYEIKLPSLMATNHFPFLKVENIFRYMIG